jgi:protein SCO1/2
MTQKTLRIWIWVVVAVLGLGMGGGVLLLRQGQQPEAASFGQASFSLLDQNGTPVDQMILKGQPSVLFFGFTHCPEVCPTTLAEMSTWFEQLGEEGRDLKGYFVSVDPERDTPDILGEYIEWVPRVTGLTGTPEEVAKLAKAWGVYYAKQPLEGGDYTMDHTASVFLLDANGDFQGTIAYGEDSATAIGKIRNLLAAS